MITREHLIRKLRTSGYEVEECGPKIKATRGKSSFWITIGDEMICAEEFDFPYARGYFLRGNSMIRWMKRA